MNKRNGMRKDPRRIAIGESFRARLKKAMDTKHISSLELAKKLGDGWNPANIDDYMNTAKEPSFFTVAVMANALGVSCDYLAGFTDNASSKVEKALAAETLGLSSLSEAALDCLASLLVLCGHWRRSKLSSVRIQNRWNPVAPDCFPEGYYPPIRDYQLYPLTSSELINSLLSEDISPSIIESILVSSLDYIELKDAYAYIERLRAKEKEHLGKKSILSGLQRNEYDSFCPGSERSSFDKLNHDNDLKSLKQSQVITKAILHEQIDNLLDLFFEKHIKPVQFAEYTAAAEIALSDLVSWNEALEQLDKEMKDTRAAAEAYFSDSKTQEMGDDGWTGDNDDYCEDEESRARLMEKARKDSMGRIDG